MSASWRVSDEIIDYRWVGQGTGITQILQLVLGDLPQDATHDFAGAGFWQPGGPLQDVRLGDGDKTGEQAVGSS